MQKCCNEKCCNEKCCNKKCCNKKCCNEKCHKQPRRLSSFTSTDLLSKSDAPSHLTDTEPYILRGFRPRLTLLGCLKSLFQLHNESMNIWTHLLGSLYMYVLTKRRWYSTATSHAGLRRVPPLLVGTAGTALFAASATAHCLCAHGEHTCKCCFAVDKSMISYFLLGCALSSSLVYFRRPTQSLNRFLFATAAALSSTFGALQISGVIGDTSKLFNVLVLASQAVTGLIPPVLELTSTHRRDVKKIIVQRAALATGLAFVGASFYASRYPEKQWPNYFDYFGNSHTLMHIFVVGSAHVAFHGYSEAVDLVLR